MKTASPFIITISRQLGSGGAYIGQQLAKKLDILYLDREIISKAAAEFSLSESDLETLDEKTTSIAGAVLRLCQFGIQDAYTPPQIYLPTDYQLFEVESQIIKNISLEHSGVIIGRCASHILRGTPNHVSVFLHASMEYRKARVQKIYNVSCDAAETLIMQSDNERQRYNKKFSREEWTDGTRYNIVIDTSKINIDDCADFIVEYLNYFKKGNG